MEEHPFDSDRTMLKSLKIENFRGFQAFELKQLGRINLIVGKNNSGKTSILEAIQLWASRLNLRTMRSQTMYRGEYLEGEKEELAINNLFHNRHLKLDSNFIIIGNRENSQEKLTFSICKSMQQDRDSQWNIDNLGKLELAIQFLISDLSNDIKLIQNRIYTLSPKDGFFSEVFLNSRHNDSDPDPIPNQIVSSSSLPKEEIRELFDEFSLTDKEDLIYEALHYIDPSIQRIVPLTNHGRYSVRDGFKVRLSTSNQPVPIGSLGDGVWRMLAIMLALLKVENGIILLDEIDTGLHFSTMESMWRMILKTAKLLNVQVFATTHSRDCWESLAQVVQDEGIARDEVVIHRIEPQKTHSVEFDGRLMSIAMDENIEVR